MPIKSFRPTTPTRRFQTYLTRDEITKDRPEKSLVEGKKRTGGRDARGRISSRFRGGGAKQAYRLIPPEVATIDDGAVLEIGEYEVPCFARGRDSLSCSREHAATSTAP